MEKVHYYIYYVFPTKWQTLQSALLHKKEIDIAEDCVQLQ